MTVPIRVHRLASPLGEWELALGEPSPALRPYVLGSYAGSVERIAGTLTRLEVPHPGVTCIFSFGDPYRVTDPRRAGHGEWMGSFVAGLYDSYVHVDARGVSQCVQCNLTPLGAVRLLGIPLEALANRSEPMRAVLGSFGDTLVEQLQEAPSWEERFRVLELGWLARLRRAPAIPDAVVRAWGALEATAGNLTIERLARDVDCSRRRLTAQFREHVGLPPKVLARILRFHRVVGRMQHGDAHRLSEVAHACGYYDHAHFDRDFREFSGLSPSAYLALRHPTFGAIVPGD